MELSSKDFEKFFISDLKIKRLIHKVARNEICDYDDNSRIKYEEILLESIEIIAAEFEKMSPLFFNDIGRERLKLLLDNCKQELLSCNYDYQRMKRIYEKYFTNMNEELIAKTRDNLCGYSMFRDINSLFNRCSSFNEMLHVIHCYITNNEEFYNSVPQLDTKLNSNGYPISLYGDRNELAQEIFSNFPLELDCGWTDILSLGNTGKILMMIRDRGHALSIEISEEDEQIWVNYFIPKICNVDMVNKLNGVRKVTPESRNTIGCFVTTKQQLNNSLFSFIKNVPTDDDMVFGQYIKK